MTILGRHKLLKNKYFFLDLSWDRWTLSSPPSSKQTKKKDCFIILTGSASCFCTWRTEELDSPNSVEIQESFWKAVITLWYLLGLLPSPCQEVIFYLVVSLTTFLTEKHLVKNCNVWHLECEAIPRCLKLKCADEKYRRSLFLLLSK